MNTRPILKLTTALAAFALAPASLAAQESAEATEEVADEANPMDEAMGMLAGMFSAEPLTAEQEARLPLAESIIAKMMPDGTMAEMMGGMYDKMLGPIMEMGGGAAKTTAAKGIGVTSFEIDVTDEQAAEIATLFDPAFAEREKIQSQLFPELMGEMMSAMEPGMRKAMAELYAINFTTSELAEIDVFFSTDTGASFARKSYTMASDPRILAASMESLPLMMEKIADLETRMKEAEAGLPEVKTFNDLSDDQKARVVELTGFSAEDIEYNLSAQDFEWDEAEEAEEAVEAEEEAAYEE